MRESTSNGRAIKSNPSINSNHSFAFPCRVSRLVLTILPPSTAHTRSHRLEHAHTPPLSKRPWAALPELHSLPILAPSCSTPSDTLARAGLFAYEPSAGADRSQLSLLLVLLPHSLIHARGPWPLARCPLPIACARAHAHGKVHGPRAKGLTWAAIASPAVPNITVQTLVPRAAHLDPILKLQHAFLRTVKARPGALFARKLKIARPKSSRSYPPARPHATYPPNRHLEILLHRPSFLRSNRKITQYSRILLLSSFNHSLSLRCRVPVDILAVRRAHSPAPTISTTQKSPHLTTNPS